MLNREQSLMLYRARYTSGCLFSKLPIELIREISECGRDDSEFNEALHYVAYGELLKVKIILDNASKQQDKTALKILLLQAGTTVTRAGVIVKRTTLLECALGSGDPEMITLIMSYFLKFNCGVEILQRQLENYRSCIEDMQTQKPYDLTWLIEIILTSSPNDIAAELATGKDYDRNYQSALRNALNQFRTEKLDSKVRIITKPQMHCNYQNLKHAYDMLNYVLYDLTDTSLEKCYLIANQVIGLIELLELPAYERYVFSRGQFDTAIRGGEVERSLQYESNREVFPNYDESLINNHSGVGYDSYISVCGAADKALVCDMLQKHLTQQAIGCEFAALISNKILMLKNLLQPYQTETKTAGLLCRIV